MESEEDAGPVDPYPLEGKYMNEEDRERLMDMNELDREEILAQRLEEKQRYSDSIKLERMHKAMGQTTSDGEDAVSRAAKRKHIAPGTNRVKTQSLVELKAKRAARTARTSKKEESRRAPSDSGSGSDMEESDEEEGQVTRRDEREDKLDTRKPKDEEKLERDDLEKIRLTRDAIEKWCHMQSFQVEVKGFFVRFLVGPGDDGRSVYRVCEITGLTPESATTYKIQDTPFNQQALLRHGGSTRAFNLDRISNGPFTDREFDRWVAQCATEKVPLPKKAEINQKAAKLELLRNHIPTEDEISQMIARKNRISGKGNLNQAYAEKSRLHQERALAVARHDHAEVTRLDEIIRAQEASSPAPINIQDNLAKVNERNRKANLERIRKAEAAEAEERRRQGGLRPPVVRKLHSSSTGNTPVLGPQDASKDNIQPLVLDGGGLLTPGGATPTGSPSPSPKKQAAPRLESKLATSIDLDLGDF